GIRLQPQAARERNVSGSLLLRSVCRDRRGLTVTLLRVPSIQWRSLIALVAVMSCSAMSCSPVNGEQMKTGSQTNWLMECSSTTECGELECVCGACTLPCDAELQCAGLDGASCVGESDPGAVALCGGQT